ncbi:FAD binding domain-containing protein [Cupriavidus consociatus]|uniref:FAD binding domain-containing protein n=1 Tax=Cupriavidus consociatus TaxID=2821357 RepID=UPI001AE74401|nr:MULTISPECIES: xanthine dehydrogenase family protein subunit M [unclassified Cupriavidus]MBP0623754.1 xanthine dehydrogenase family protein subunit M [Cupriavidus sp. LEh25]MDK2660461.1 xanthine dehydrogenase family protein subunit M [Cupriavidus sp. LEh21]
MKPAPFDYCAPDSVEEALDILATHGGDAKVMAGGQSLTPMLNFRVVRPNLIVDISRLIELDYVRSSGQGGLTVGALTRHRELETSSLVASRFPVIPETMVNVAHLAIRNRGTIGGSLSHADPAAELPMLTRLLDAEIVVRSTRGERVIASEDFFVAPLTSALEEDEIVVRVEFPGLATGMGWCFQEFARRAGDFALAAVGVLLDVRDGIIHEARVAMMGVGDTPLRRPESEAVLTGSALSDAVVAEAVQAACVSLEPNVDLHASPEFRRHLAGVLMERVLRKAWQRSAGVKA